MTDVVQERVEPLEFDLISAQGKAISNRLQLAFPPSLFQFKYLPPNPDRTSWKSLTQGNQPFLGLGFMGAVPSTDGQVFTGVVSWLLLVAVRQSAGTPKSLFFGDTAPGGIGVLKMAGVAAAMLQGFVAATGSVTVKKISNAISDAWSEDSAVLALDLQVPVRLELDDVITKPGGIGLFTEMDTTWNVPVPKGSVDIYTSDWENPNVPS